jgi:hypothetical protein
MPTAALHGRPLTLSQLKKDIRCAIDGAKKAHPSDSDRAAASFVAYLAGIVGVDDKTLGEEIFSVFGYAETAQQIRDGICGGDGIGNTYCSNHRHTPTFQGATFMDWKCTTCGGTGRSTWE